MDLQSRGRHGYIGGPASDLIAGRQFWTAARMCSSTSR
jgi:hypothetical protein